MPLLGRSGLSTTLIVSTLCFESFETAERMCRVRFGVADDARLVDGTRWGERVQAGAERLDSLGRAR